MKCFKMLLFISFFLSCNRHVCPITVDNNKREFQKYLKVISNYEEGNKGVLVDDYREAINFLSRVTGIESRADYSSTFGYSNKEEYKGDMLQWKNWFKVNNCKLTKSYIDSAVNSSSLVK